MSCTELSDKIKLNYKTIFDYSIKFWSAVAFIAGMFGWEGLPDSLKFINSCVIYKIIFLLLVWMLILIIVVVYVCYFLKNNTIWKNGSGEISIEYNDLFKIAGNVKHRSDKYILAIPVNDAFDIIVDENISNVEYPLVSSNTLHGLWLKYMYRVGSSKEDIEKKIELSLKNIIPVNEYTRQEKTRGNLKSYSIGTVASVSDLNGVNYYLLSISKFDFHNTAHSSPSNIQLAVNRLIEYYNVHGQGYDLYIPVMGAGLSRSDLTKKEALQVIKSTLLANQKNIYGKIHIVIYEKDKNEISIFD